MQASARLSGDGLQVGWALAWPVGVVAVVGGVLGVGLQRALARWRPAPGGVEGGWAALIAVGLLPLAPDWSVWLLGPLWGAVWLLVWRWPLLAPLGVVGLGVGLAARLPPAGSSGRVVGEGSGPSIVLITLDTFRADHVGAIGGWRRVVHTPHLDALAAEGTLYVDGVADAPLTGPSHAAMLSGLPPWELGVVRNGDRAQSDTPWVAERLAEAGYRTGAFVSSRVLDPSVGLDGGFAHYDHHADAVAMATEGSIRRGLVALGVVAGRASQRRGDVTVARALRWLDAGEGPAFVWVHLYDPHAPYDPPEPWSERYDPHARDAPGHPDEVQVLRSAGRRVVDFLPRDLRPSIAAYAGEIAWTDALVGQLLAALPEDTRVLVAADHGESLLEHGYLLNHGASVHQPSIRVPMWVRAPGYRPGRRVEAPVASRRVAATLLELAGVGPDGPTLADPPSPDWLASYSPGQQSRFDLRLDRSRLVSLRRGSEKWIVDERGPVQWFDLAADPTEEDPHVGAEGAASARATADAIFEALRAAEGRATASAELEEALEALGYVE